MVLPVAAFALASAGAVTTQTNKSAVESSQTLYFINKPLSPCQSVAATCNNIPSTPCMYNDGVSNWQVFRRLNVGSPCNITTYHQQ